MPYMLTWRNGVHCFTNDFLLLVWTLAETMHFYVLSSHFIVQKIVCRFDID